MADKIFLIVPFIFGAVVGSFLNVCIYRIPLGISIVRPSSMCPECKRRIPFYYNVPIISYAVLGGRCAFCGSPFSPQYPVVEGVTGFFAAALFMRHGLTPGLFIHFAFVSSLVVITFIDLRHRIIPDVISLPGIVAGFGASFFLTPPGVMDSAIGAVLGGAVLLVITAAYYLLTGTEGMGGGDIKLLAMIGAFEGWRGVLFTLLASSFLGAFVGVGAIAFFGKSSKYAIPFGPFLAAGALLYLFYGDAVIDWYVMRAAAGF